MFLQWYNVSVKTKQVLVDVKQPFSVTCLLILLQVVDLFCCFLIPFFTVDLKKTSRTSDSYLADEEGSHVVSVLKNLSCGAVQYLLKSLNYYSNNCNLKQLFDFRTFEIWNI